jgi:TonB family protein
MCGHAMQRAGVRRARRILLLLLALAAVPGANAQQTAMDAAAGQLAGAISHSKQRTLAILDFSGPGDKVTALGEKLADDLSVAITKSAGNLQVEDRSRIEEKRKENSYAPEIVVDPPSALLFAQELGAKAFVIGSMSLGESNVLNVDLNAYRVDNGKGINGLRISFPLTEELAVLMGMNVSNYELPADLSSKYPKANAPGYSPPRCIYCPRADYAAEALNKRLEGVVELVAIVGEDGRVTNIAVVKGLPGGLTAQAIEAVKKWRLNPATGPDGKPAAVRQIIEVSFRLF